MMNFNCYMADFETTTYENQTFTEVWASAIVPLEAPTEKSSVLVDNSIDNFMWYVLLKLQGNSKIYFHNLKFDGMFILSWLKKHNDMFREYNFTVDNEKRLKKTTGYEIYNRRCIYLFNIR